ncbi:MAG: hypothetical protein JST89_07040 [Cyanobacteria bacterium SZAS-4]|nr:hypothetical protein [Cyanobacteria bacterium SZAS-4]
MTRFQISLFTTISLLVVAPSAVRAGNSHNVEAEQATPIQTAAVHGTPSHGPGQVTSYACGGASASFISGPGKSGYILQNANHTYGCDGTPTGGGAGATYVGASVTPTPFTGLSFSLRNGKNGTVNVYLLTDQAPYPTYSVSFSSLTSADFTVAPGQFNPPVTSGTPAVGVVFDANPCQQVTIKNITVSGSVGVLQVHGGTSCPQFVTCQQPR